MAYRKDGLQAQVQEIVSDLTPCFKVISIGDQVVN